MYIIIVRRQLEDKYKSKHVTYCIMWFIYFNRKMQTFLKVVMKARKYVTANIIFYTDEPKGPVLLSRSTNRSRVDY